MSFSLILLVVVSSYLCFIEQSTAFLHSSGFSGPSLSRRMVIVASERVGSNREGALLLYKESKVRNLNIRYMFVLESFLFISADSLGEVHVLPPTFPSASMQVKHFRQSTHIASKGECRKRTLDQTFFHSCPWFCNKWDFLGQGRGGVGEKHL